MDSVPCCHLRMLTVSVYKDTPSIPVKPDNHVDALTVLIVDGVSDPI